LVQDAESSLLSVYADNNQGAPAEDYSGLQDVVEAVKLANQQKQE